MPDYIDVLSCTRDDLGDGYIFICPKCKRLYNSCKIERCTKVGCTSDHLIGIDLADPRITKVIIDLYTKYNVSVWVTRPDFAELQKVGFTFHIMIPREDVEATELFGKVWDNLGVVSSILKLEWNDFGEYYTDVHIDTAPIPDEEGMDFITSLSNVYSVWYNTIERFMKALDVAKEKED